MPPRAAFLFSSSVENRAFVSAYEIKKTTR